MRPVRLRIGLVTPAPPGSRKGNRVTALRWTRLLRQLGHQITVLQEYRSQPFDLLIALHARRSASSIGRFRRWHDRGPIVVALTGTDLYSDLRTSTAAQQSLRTADRLVVLQPLGIRALPAGFRDKARVILQSVSMPAGLNPGRASGPRPLRRHARSFDVCVLGHLRPVKDPFRTALAARHLPASSRILVRHFGAALSPSFARRARREMQANPRYCWYGEVPRYKALRRLARSDVLVISSMLEGGANVISEAIALGIPVIASQIDGSVGLLGEEYPAYFPVGDTQALAALLCRAETDRRWYRALRRHCGALRPLVAPAREQQAWRKLLDEL